MTNISAVLLAAGASTRMGRPKALAPWLDSTLLEYQLAQLAAVGEIREIIVVTGHEPGRITQIASAAPRTRALFNAAFRTGKASSIRAGLGAVSPHADAILLLAVDQPRASRIVQAVIDRYDAERPVITVPTNAGHRGHPVLFDRVLLHELTLVSDEAQGVRAVMRAHADRTVEVELRDPAVNLDLNTPADLRGAARR